MYRLAVGGARLALAVMLLYGITKYFALIVPRYGHRFAYVAIVMGGVACWAALRGVLILVGRTREGG